MKSNPPPAHKNKIAMKTAITLVLGFFCFLSFESCRCDPDDDNAKKENTSSESKNAENGNHPENDSISLSH